MNDDTNNNNPEVTADTPPPAAPTPPNAAKEQRTADKPHHLTLIYNYITLTVSLIAAALSYAALTVNSRSLEIGQKAYLTVSITVKLDSNVAEYVMTIKNLGNTPARAVILSYSLEGTGPGLMKEHEQHLQDLGPKDSYEFPIASEGFRDNYPVYKFYGNIRFTNVFSQHNVAPFCYETAFNPKMMQQCLNK